MELMHKREINEIKLKVLKKRARYDAYGKRPEKRVGGEKDIDSVKHD